jgi:hypothetical protein
MQGSTGRQDPTHEIASEPKKRNVQAQIRMACKRFIGSIPIASPIRVRLGDEDFCRFDGIGGKS